MRSSAVAVIIAILLLGIGTFAVFQMNTNKELKTSLEERENDVTELTDDLSLQKEKVAGLTHQNEILKDSIIVLNRRIAALEKELTAKKEEIYGVRKEIKRLTQKLEDRKKEISTLYRKRSLDQKAIDDLEKEKKSLAARITTLETKKEDLKDDAKKIEDIKTDEERNRIRMSELTDISENTQVNFDKIVLKQFDNPKSRKRTRITLNSRVWKYTYIDFSLFHPGDHRLILDKNFILEVYDLDNEKTLVFEEMNPKFQEKKLQGKVFTFDGNALNLKYANTEKKRSLNYEIRIHLMNGPNDYITLENGVFQFIKNGKLVQPK